MKVCIKNSLKKLIICLSLGISIALSSLAIADRNHSSGSSYSHSGGSNGSSYNNNRYGGDNGHWYHHNERVSTSWRSGHWRHESFGGRLGWYWLAGGLIYAFAQPTYPYPAYDAYTPTRVINNTTVIQQAPPVEQASPPQDPASVWYYCAASKRYYPHVTTCPGGWQPVPAQMAPPPR